LCSAGLFSASVIYLSKISKSKSIMLALAWSGNRKLVVLRLFCHSWAQAGMFFRVPLPPPSALRPPQHPENEACCVWKNAGVKQKSVFSLPFKTKHFIAAVTPTPRFGFNRSSALALKRPTLH
jgi:hypothetical protein